MKFKKISKSEFAGYSQTLRVFESQFSYPLGDEKFHLVHGHKDYDYFGFFNKLGDVNYFVMEDESRVIGVGCAILREVVIAGRTQRFWYLCDFKIDKAYRGKNLLVKLTFKYFLQHYFKCDQIVAVNMSPPDGNWLAKKVKRLFSLFKLQTSPIYFYEWTYEDFYLLYEQQPYLFNGCVLVTNDGHKDIVINGEVKPVLHIVQEEYAEYNLPHHKHYQIRDVLMWCRLDKEITENSLVMMATMNRVIPPLFSDLDVDYKYQGTMITRKGFPVDAFRFSSLEI